MADVVDLALSDDDEDVGHPVVQEIDLSDDLLIASSPNTTAAAVVGGTGAGAVAPGAPAAQASRSARMNSFGGGAGIAAAAAAAGFGAIGCAGASSSSKTNPPTPKRNKRVWGSTKNSPGGVAAAAADNAVLIDDDGDLDANGDSTSTCVMCTNEENRPLFTLERCEHALCPACVMTKISAPVTPVCPSCGEAVSVRDLALILEENAWCELQTKRVAAFRERASKGCRCPSCETWVEPPSSSSSEQPRGAGGIVEVGAGGRSSGGRGGGTARQRAESLLSSPPLVCLQGHYLCQFCGVKLKPRAPGCACGCAKLLAFSGLLSLLEELAANPASVELCGPVGPLPKLGGGRGRGGGKRGRGRGSYSFMAGRGGGGGGRGGASWEALFSGASGFGYGGYGGGGAKSSISSKWSKGTGYGGSGDAAAAASAQAMAAEAESRADRAMVVVFDALAKCLPARGDSPEHLPELLALVRESSLLQLVCAYLRNDSLMDIAKRRELYQVSRPLRPVYFLLSSSAGLNSSSLVSLLLLLRVFFWCLFRSAAC